MPSNARNRLPTLFEVLNGRSQPPVDLFSFYVYMRQQYRGVDYLDFWLATVDHLTLCRHYVRSLRQSLLNSEHNDSSRTSSVLLDAIIQEAGLNDGDTTRLSSFLRGEDITNGTSVYRLSELLDAMDARERDMAELHSPASRHDNFVSRVNQSYQQQQLQDQSVSRQQSVPTEGTRYSYHADEVAEKHKSMRSIADEYFNEKQGTPILPGPSSGFHGPGNYETQSFNTNSDRTTSSGSHNPARTPFLNHADNSDSTSRKTSDILQSAAFQQPANRGSNAEMIERLFPPRQSQIDDSSNFVTRQRIKESSHNILVTYLMHGAEREIVLPPRIMKGVRQAIEVEGRDDPEVFDEAREYVFQAMEREAYPMFLAARALGNVCPLGSFLRLLVGLFALFAGVWVGLVLIFLDWQPKTTRLWTILPFGIAVYGILTSLYNLCPIMAFLSVSESYNYGLTRIKEPYVHRLLIKRSLFVSAVIIVVTAIFVIIFALVPGRRL